LFGLILNTITPKNPVNNTAVKVNNQAKEQDRTNYMKNIAREHGLIFFFRSDCPYCHQYAPTLKLLSEMYGIEVLGVSIDGAVYLNSRIQETDVQ
jgi:conjugal transfer pilus assembly protein TraF